MTDPTQPPGSLWQLKPWWCQPWSIVLTGLAMPAAVWLVTQRLWLVMPVVLLVTVWWFLFLYVVPKQYREDLLSKNL